MAKVSNREMQARAEAIKHGSHICLEVDSLKLADMGMAIAVEEDGTIVVFLATQHGPMFEERFLEFLECELGRIGVEEMMHNVHLSFAGLALKKAVS